MAIAMTVHSQVRGTSCTLVCTASALEWGNLELGRVGPKKTRSEGGWVLTSPRGRYLLSLEGLLAGCWMEETDLHILSFC